MRRGTGVPLARCSTMIPPSICRLVAVCAALLATGASAWAQSACQRYRAELASLGSGDGARDAAAAQQLRAEIGRMAGYYQSIGCDRGSFLFSSPPAECGAIAARIRAMQSTYAELAGRGSSDGSEMRRAELRAIVTQVCREEDVRRSAERKAQETVRREFEEPRRIGGDRVVCVRACDGFYFPLDSRPAGRASEDQLCQALCPGAEAAAYRMPLDGEIKEAVSFKGRPYVRLANAFKYQKAHDASCSCKPDGKSWTEALQKAERMIERQRGDMIVTAQKAEELSRPKLARATARGKDKAGPAQKEAFASAKLDAAKVDPKTAQAAKQSVEAKSASAPDAAEEGERPAVASQPLDVDATGSTTPKNMIRVVSPKVTPVQRSRPE